MKKRLSKQQLREKQKLNEKKFNRTMLISFGILFISVLSILVFYTYWCDTRLAWHKVALFPDAVSGDSINKAVAIIGLRKRSKT
jgi:hypothetical protein